MTTPLRLTRPAKIHCLARLLGVSGCFRSNQSNNGLALVSVIAPIWAESKVPLIHGTCEPELWTAAGGPNDNYKSPLSRSPATGFSPWPNCTKGSGGVMEWWIDGVNQARQETAADRHRSSGVAPGIHPQH